MQFQQAFNISRGLEHGWEAFRRVPLPLFLGGLLMRCTEGGGGGGSGNTGSSPWDDGSSSGGGIDFDYRMDLGDLLRADVPPVTPDLGGFGLGAAEAGIILAIIAGGVICMALVWVFRSLLHTGYIRLHVSSLESGQGGVGDLFSGADRLVPMMLWKLLKSLIITGAVLVAAVPGILVAVFGGVQEQFVLMFVGMALAGLLAVPVGLYIGLGLAFGDHAVALDALGPTDALEKSWEMASGNRLHLLLFLFVYAIVNVVAAFVGLLMLCVGALITIPTARAVTDIGFTEGYLMLTGRAGDGGVVAVFD